jgi:hypothetical protein
MQNEQTRTYLVLSYWNCTASSFSFISVMSRLRVTSFVRVSSLWQSMLCEWLEFHMHVRASESTHFYLVPTPRFGFALYGTCIHPSLQYANPLRAPIIRAGSVCAARHERTFACARCHPAPAPRRVPSLHRFGPGDATRSDTVERTAAPSGMSQRTAAAHEHNT